MAVGSNDDAPEAKIQGSGRIAICWDNVPEPFAKRPMAGLSMEGWDLEKLCMNDEHGRRGDVRLVSAESTARSHG